MRLYNFVPYQESLDAVIETMKINLEMVEPKMTKTFSFDASVPYEENIIGKMSEGSTNLTLLPDFTGDSTFSVLSYGSAHGIKIIVKGSGTRVVSQSVPFGADVEFVKTLTVTLGGGSTTVTTPKQTETPKPSEEPEESEEPMIPDSSSSPSPSQSPSYSPEPPIPGIPED